MTPRALLAIVLLLVPATARGQSRPDSDPQPEILRGERLDPSLYGPGVVESMEEVVARDQARATDNYFNPKARGNRHGSWVVPRERATYRPHSGERYVTNTWGDTRMGIGFPKGPVTVVGAWIAGQGGGPGVWPASLRVIGYREGREIATTAWYETIEAEPKWMAIDLREVDRIVFEARPANGGAAWFAIDDLTYSVVSGRDRSHDELIILDFEDCRPGQKLTGSDYAGLSWEEGTGDFKPDYLGIHTPRRTADDQQDEEQPGIDEPEGEPREPRDVTLPILGVNYQGVIRGDASQMSYPPDTCGAVGPNHFVVVVNTNFSVYAKNSGSRVVNTSLNSFQPGSGGDPRVLFDQHSGRWITINTNFDWSPPSRIFLAVSTTNDPTGTWFKTSFIAQEGSDASCWVDYPTLGVDANGIYVSANMIGCNSTVFAIDKAPLIAATPSLGTVTAFRGLSEGTIQPVHTYGTPGYQYFIGRSGNTTFRIRQLSGPLTDPILESPGTVTVPSHAAPPDVPALGSDVPLDSVDRRLMNAVYRAGYIWTTNTLSVNTRAACRWYKINPVSRTLIEYGTVSDSSLHYFFPSIMVNSAGDAFMGFSGANADQYVAAYYTGRLSTDTAGQMAVPAVLKAGVAPQNNIDQYGRNRWGDYSLCSLDPADDTVVWAIQAYGHATNIWGTWIGRLSYTPPPPDLDPPTPNPMTFSTPPYGDSTSSVRMIASLADDASPPVKYFFDFVAGGTGGDDSTWQDARMYLDTGLQINTYYTYRVKARDSAGTPNETGWSAELTTATLAAVPSAPALSGPTANSLLLDVQPGVNPAHTQFAVQCTATNPPDANWTGAFVTPGGTPSAAPTWQTDAEWGVRTIVGLQPSTNYTFAVKARNLDNIETALGLAAALTTLATPAGACCFYDGGCSTMTAADCGIAAGDYQGDYVSCDPNPCPIVCEVPGDLNEDWLVDGRDIAGFVEAVIYGYHPCADLAPPEGELNVDDIAAFVDLLLYGG